MLLQLVLFLQQAVAWLLLENVTGLVVCHRGRAVAPVGQGDLLQDGGQVGDGL